MRVLGIIPARGGSKRLPGKNLRKLGGKPLVAWVIESAMRASLLQRLVVSSDDEEILQVARGCEPTLPLERPAALATDTSPAIDYVQHALLTLEGAGEEHYDAVAIIQPSSPLTLLADIDATIMLLETSGADTAVSVVKVAHDVHPLKFKVMQGNRLLSYLEEEAGRMAADELPDVYVRNCAVYATKRDVVDARRVIGDDCRGYVMPRDRSIDINDLSDLRFAEFLMGLQEHAPADKHAV